MGGVFLLLVLILMVFKIFQKVSSIRSKTSLSTIAKSPKRTVKIEFPLEKEKVHSSYLNNRDRLLTTGDSEKRQLMNALLHDQRNTVV